VQCEMRWVNLSVSSRNFHHAAGFSFAAATPAASSAAAATPAASAPALSLSAAATPAAGDAAAATPATPAASTAPPGGELAIVTSTGAAAAAAVQPQVGRQCLRCISGDTSIGCARSDTEGCGPRPASWSALPCTPCRSLSARGERTLTGSTRTHGGPEAWIAPGVRLGWPTPLGAHPFRTGQQLHPHATIQ